MRQLATLLLIALLASCSHELTRNQRRAQKHLNKAIRLDSNIVRKQRTSVHVAGVAMGNINLKIDGATITSYPFDCDALYQMLTTSKVPVTIGTGRAGTITAGINDSGKITIDAHTSGLDTNLTVHVPYDTTVQVDGKLITSYKEYPATHYIWFWGLMAASLVLLALFLVTAIMFIKK